MRKIFAILFLLAVLPAQLALARDDCFVPMADWQPRAAVQQMAEANGWTVRRIKIDDGCYEIKGTDAAGRSIKVKIDPGTLAIVDFKLKDDDHHN